MRAGGWFDGVRAPVTVAVIDNPGFCERIATLNVWTLVTSTGTNVHVAGPDVLGSPSRSIVSVPVHVPARNDCAADGDVGTGVPPPHVAARQDAGHRTDSRFCALIRALLCWCRLFGAIQARARSDRPVHRSPAPIRTPSRAGVRRPGQYARPDGWRERLPRGCFGAEIRRSP